MIKKWSSFELAVLALTRSILLKAVALLMAQHVLAMDIPGVTNTSFKYKWML